MSKYYYRGINCGTETQDCYNSHVVNKINQLSNYILQENKVKEIRSKGKKFDNIGGAHS